MRVLMLSQWFQPEPFFKGLPLAKELVRRGHQVEVLTGFPNYPGGKVYDGYAIRGYQREEMEGVTVHRTWLYPSHDRSGLKRMANYASFALSSLLLGVGKVQRPDVVYAYNLVSLRPTLARLRRKFGCPVVMDIQDLWPESVSDSGMMSSGLLQGVLRRQSDLAYQSADALVCLSPGFKENLAARGIAPDRIHVVYNWADAEAVGARDEAKAREVGMPEGFVVMFAGTMGKAQGVDVVLEAAEITSRSNPEVKFALVGGGTEVPRLQDRARQMGLSNVVFVPRQERAEMGRVFSLADALLVHLTDTKLHRVTIPSKTQAYLAAGKPIVMASTGDAAELVARSAGGVICPPSDPAAMAGAVLGLASLSVSQRKVMADAGRRFFDERLTMEKGVDALMSVFSGLGRV